MLHLESNRYFGATISPLERGITNLIQLMANLLNSLTLLVLLLIPLGGTFFKFTWAKIEVGTVSPFILVIILFCAYGWAFKKQWLVQYHGRIRSAQAVILEQGGSGTFRRRAWLFLGVITLGLYLADLFRFWNFRTSLYDMVYSHSVLFHPWHDGHWAHCALSPLKSFFVDHFAPTMLVASPIFSHLRISEAVILFQTGLLMLGVFILIRHGPLRERPRLWLMGTLVLLCARPLIRPGIDLREDHFAFFFLCLTLASLHRGNWVVYFGSLLLFLGSKEHTPIVASGLLAPILWDNSLGLEKRQRGVATVLTAFIIIGYGGLIYAWIIPTLQAPVGQTISQVTLRLPQLGDSLVEIISSPVTQPASFWGWLWTRLGDPSCLRYLFWVLAPYLLFSRRSPAWLLAATPGIVANLIPLRPEQRNLGWHYELAFAPFLMVACLKGIRAIPSYRTWGIALGAALLFSQRWPAFDAWQNMPPSAVFKDAIEFHKTPCDQAIAANQWGLAHLAHCPELHHLHSPKDCMDPGPTLISLLNDAGPSGIPGEGARGAQRIVLDRKDRCESLIADWLGSQIGAPEWQSPSGRWVRYPLKALATTPGAN